MIQPSLTRRDKWMTAMFPALKDRAKFKRSYAAYFMQELHYLKAKFRYLVYNNRKLITERI
jgi:hypothetical protein